jgi:hypothetical protein
MYFIACPSSPGMPGHTEADEAKARAWARRYATAMRTTYVVWRVEAGRPQKLAEVRPRNGR